MSESISVERPLFRREKPKIVFRVYYDAKTMRCLFKSIEPDVNSEYPHLVVDYATYESISVCDSYQVVGENISKIQITTSHKKLMPGINGRFTTTKNNMMFVADQEFAGETETWDYIRYDV